MLLVIFLGTYDLALENQLVCASLGKTISPSPRSPKMSIDFWCRVQAWWAFAHPIWHFHGVVHVWEDRVFFFVCLFSWFLETRFHCTPGCPGTCSEDPADLELGDLPVGQLC